MPRMNRWERRAHSASPALDRTCWRRLRWPSTYPQARYRSRRFQGCRKERPLSCDPNTSPAFSEFGTSDPVTSGRLAGIGRAGSPDTDAVCQVRFARRGACVTGAGHPCDPLRVRLLAEKAQGDRPCPGECCGFAPAKTGAEDGRQVLVDGIEHRRPGARARIRRSESHWAHMLPAISRSSSGSLSSSLPGFGYPGTRIGLRIVLRQSELAAESPNVFDVNVVLASDGDLLPRAVESSFEDRCEVVDGGEIGRRKRVFPGGVEDAGEGAAVDSQPKSSRPRIVKSSGARSAGT